MSFDMWGTLHFTSVHVAEPRLIRTCCWQPWTHFSPLPTSKGPPAAVTEATVPAASGGLIHLELVDQSGASENPKPIKGAESLSRRGLEGQISCSLEMVGYSGNTDLGHSRPAVTCCLQGAQCWL